MQCPQALPHPLWTTPTVSERSAPISMEVIVCLFGSGISEQSCFSMVQLRAMVLVDRWIAWWDIYWEEKELNSLWPFPKQLRKLSMQWFLFTQRKNSTCSILLCHSMEIGFHQMVP